MNILSKIPMEGRTNKLRFLRGYLVHIFHFENAPIRAGYDIAALT